LGVEIIAPTEIHDIFEPDFTHWPNENCIGLIREHSDYVPLGLELGIDILFTKE
jgi:hypothetical protein